MHVTADENKPMMMKYLCFPWSKEKVSKLRGTVVTTLIPFLFRANTTSFSWGIPYCSWVLCQTSGTWCKNVRSLLTFLTSPDGLLYCTFMVFHSLKATQSSRMSRKLLGVVQFKGQWSQLGTFHWLQLIWAKFASLSKNFELFQAFVRWRSMLTILE